MRPENEDLENKTTKLLKYFVKDEGKGFADEVTLDVKKLYSSKTKKIHVEMVGQLKLNDENLGEKIAVIENVGGDGQGKIEYEKIKKDLKFHWSLWDTIDSSGYRGVSNIDYETLNDEFDRITLELKEKYGVLGFSYDGSEIWIEFPECKFSSWFDSVKNYESYYEGGYSDPMLGNMHMTTDRIIQSREFLIEKAADYIHYKINREVNENE
jgi:hypothetical protein